MRWQDAKWESLRIRLQRLSISLAMMLVLAAFSQPKGWLPSEPSDNLHRLTLIQCGDELRAANPKYDNAMSDDICACRYRINLRNERLSDRASALRVYRGKVKAVLDRFEPNQAILSDGTTRAQVLQILAQLDERVGAAWAPWRHFRANAQAQEQIVDAFIRYNSGIGLTICPS